MGKDKLGEHFINGRALISKVFTYSGFYPNGDEFERQILGTYCFGVINGYAMENRLHPGEAHGLMLSLLIRMFGYGTEAAAGFCEELIRSTDIKYNETMYAIIHRGLEGYFMLKKEDSIALKNDVEEVMRVVKGDA